MCLHALVGWEDYIKFLHDSLHHSVYKVYVLKCHSDWNVCVCACLNLFLLDIFHKRKLEKITFIIWTIKLIFIHNKIDPLLVSTVRKEPESWVGRKWRKYNLRLFLSISREKQR